VQKFQLKWGFGFLNSSNFIQNKFTPAKGFMSDNSDDILKQYLKDNPNFEEDYGRFNIAFNDIKASLNHGLYLKTIDETIPIRLINIMVERMNEIKEYKISKYGMYRDSEDYLTKTDWFFKLANDKQFKIRFDFYNNIILGIHDAFYR